MTTRDFTFAWESADAATGPWQHLEVVQIRGHEAISSLYRYEITAFAREPAPEIDPDEIIRARASLRIATATDPPYRSVHGIITEAEELGAVPYGMLYRLVLAPPLVRAAHRTRCRIFLEKTIRQIIDAVLQGDPELARDDGATVEPDPGDMHHFRPAREVYAWRIADPSRLDRVATRPYCVEYNESDLAFVSRLLEEEGIGYHYEHGDGVCLLVLSDRDTGKTRLSPFSALGPGQAGRDVAAMKLGARLRPKKVSLVDYNWKKPALDMAVHAEGGPGPEDLVAYAYPGRYPDAPEQGRPLAAAMLDRLEVEASYATGESTCRLLGAGSVFGFEHPKARYEGEYLVTGVQIRAEQGGVLHPGGEYVPLVTMGPQAAPNPGPAERALAGVPFQVTFECARRGKGAHVAESRFRPARVTPRPRIQGTQTAFVTADPDATGAEIHIGGPPDAEIGCVRVRFHWDREAPRLAREPSSCWVRVSQTFAGVGQGSVFHPRVGTEVVVDFEDGDPDRPLVIGRVYNGRNQPSTVVPTVSTFKTDTSPGGGSHNELMFDDAAGAQQIKLHTPRDWNSEVGNDRSEQVAASSSSSVGASRNESTGSDRTTMVGANNTELVGGNETITVGGSQALGIGGDQDVGIGGSQNVGVTVDQNVVVGGQQVVEVTRDRTIIVKMDLNETIAQSRRTGITQNDDLSVEGEQNVSITMVQRTSYLADHQLTVGGDQTIGVTGKQSIDVTGAQALSSQQEQDFSAPVQSLSAQHEQSLSSETLSISATKMASIGSPVLAIAGKTTSITGKKLVISFNGDIDIQGKNVTIQASTLTLNGKQVTMGGGAEVDIQAALIKLN